LNDKLTLLFELHQARLIRSHFLIFIHCVIRYLSTLVMPSHIR